MVAEAPAPPPYCGGTRTGGEGSDQELAHEHRETDERCEPRQCGRDDDDDGGPGEPSSLSARPSHWPLDRGAAGLAECVAGADDRPARRTVHGVSVAAHCPLTGERGGYPGGVRPMVIAHRGASGHHPEHSASAVAAAFELGASAVEPDLVPSRDGVLVVRHEPEISVTTDIAERPEFAGRRRTLQLPATVDLPGAGTELEGWFTFDLDWAELAELRAREPRPELRPASAARPPEPLLAFGDLLHLVTPILTRGGEPAVVVAELKHPAAFALLGFDLVAMLLAEIEGFPPERLIVECFELDPLRRLRELGHAGRLVLLAEEAVDHAALADAGIDGISYDKSLLLGPAGPAIVADAHAAGLLVFVWTLRPENAFLGADFRGAGGEAAWGDWRGEFATVLATGVDGVFADHPELVAELLDA